MASRHPNRSKGPKVFTPPPLRMSLIRGPQSVFSPWTRWPSTWRGLKVPAPSSEFSQLSGSPSSNSRRAPGVCDSTAVASAMFTSISQAPSCGQGMRPDLWPCSITLLVAYNVTLQKPLVSDACKTMSSGCARPDCGPTGPLFVLNRPVQLNIARTRLWQRQEWLTNGKTSTRPCPGSKQSQEGGSVIMSRTILVLSHACLSLLRVANGEVLGGPGVFEPPRALAGGW